MLVEVEHSTAAKTTVEFYETTREYRLAVESFLNEAQSTSRNQANAASLQGQMQEENKCPGPSQSSYKRDSRH